MKRVRDFHSQSWNNPFFERSGGRSRFMILRSISFIIIVVVIIYIFAYSPFLRISKVKVNGTSIMDPVRIKAAVVQTMAGYDYFIIPKDHIFAINAVGIKNLVLAQFLNLLSVDVKKGFGKLDIAVEERRPTYRLIIGDKSYLLDQEGIGLREAAIGEGDALVALSEDGVVFGVGKSMVRLEWLLTISDLHKHFATQVGIRDKLLKLDETNFYLEVVTVEGWSAIFDPASDIKMQLGTLSSALAGKFSPDDRKKLLYIDARFGDKIFYRSN